MRNHDKIRESLEEKSEIFANKIIRDTKIISTDFENSVEPDFENLVRMEQGERQEEGKKLTLQRWELETARK